MQNLSLKVDPFLDRNIFDRVVLPKSAAIPLQAESSILLPYACWGMQRTKHNT